MVAIQPNPYQGLKRAFDRPPISVDDILVAIQPNPYQGLKQGFIPLMSKAFYCGNTTESLSGIETDNFVLVLRDQLERGNTTESLSGIETLSVSDPRQQLIYRGNTTESLSGIETYLDMAVRNFGKNQVAIQPNPYQGLKQKTFEELRKRMESCGNTTESLSGIETTSAG